MRRASLVLAIVACSNGGKREDVTTTMPPSDRDPRPSAPQPRVHLATAAGEVGVDVEVVATPPKIQRGLMYREHLPPDAGMLFIMGTDDEHEFWMRNTLISLDMIFIARDLTIAGIVERAEPRSDQRRRVGAPSSYVLEVNGGYCAAHGVKAGAKVRFEHVDASAR